LGLGESSTLVGLMAWGMSRLGPSRSGLVIAMVGVSMYGAFAVGGPLGLWLLDQLGFGGLMACNIALPLVAGFMLWRTPGAAPTHGTRATFAKVLGMIWMPGTVVGLQGIGFAALGAFIPLYFLSRGWSGAGYALTCFGAGFAIVRVLAGSLPDRVGGVPVALVSLCVEAAGQALLWLAPNPAMALAGSLLTGLGCSMIFPSMGLVAIKRVPPNLRGTAIGAFAAFQDLAYGLTGPVAGWIADRVGYRPVFLVGLCAALLGICMVFALKRQSVASDSKA
jgi:predicted MFS family arabinose efflux permease